MGRLVLNVLLSFAQFEREVIAERTRDKIAATRRKGRWTGGQPLLGYDVDPGRTKLVVNESEAAMVRAIFDLYLEHESLLSVVQILNERSWTTKSWVTRDGQPRGGHPFTRTSLHRLLTNVAYLGKTRYREEIHAGEHAAIVDGLVFQRVQATLARNDANGGACVRNASGSWLKGLLRCGLCDHAMTPSHSTRADKRYRYYRCASTLASGKEACPGGSISAGQIEGVVLQRLRALGTDPNLQAEVLQQARQQADQKQRELAGEERNLERDLASWSKDLLKLSAQLRPGEDNGNLIDRLSELQQRIAQVQGRVKKIQQQIQQAQQSLLNEDQASEVLGQFDPLWKEMTPREQARLVALLIERVIYDSQRGRLSITFAPAGIQSLASELQQHHEHHQQRA